MNACGTPWAFSCALTSRSHSSWRERKGRDDAASEEEERQIFLFVASEEKSCGCERRTTSLRVHRALRRRVPRMRAHRHERRGVPLQERQQLPVHHAPVLVYPVHLHHVEYHRHEDVVLDAEELGDAPRDPRLDDVELHLGHVHPSVQRRRVLRRLRLALPGDEDVAAERIAHRAGGGGGAASGAARAQKYCIAGARAAEDWIAKTGLLSEIKSAQPDRFSSNESRAAPHSSRRCLGTARTRLRTRQDGRRRVDVRDVRGGASPPFPSRVLRRCDNYFQRPNPNPRFDSIDPDASFLPPSSLLLRRSGASGSPSRTASKR